jgi:hypothetical protein
VAADFETSSKAAIVSYVKAFRRTVFIVLCAGIGLALALAPAGQPHNPLQSPNRADPLYCSIGLGCGLGMLVWCFLFKKKEQTLTRFGWIMAAIGILIACYLPPMT